MSFRKSVTLLALAALFASATPIAAQDAPALHGEVFTQLSDAEVVNRVQAVIDMAVARPEAAGLSVAVARGDHILVERGAGIADTTGNRAAGAATMFRIGSVTKQFTAAAVMKLVEQGKLSLDDPLAKYLPDFDTGGRTVTVRQLLNHTSGIPNYTAQPAFALLVNKTNLNAADVLGVVRDEPFDFEPGAGWRYSNTNYYLLGLIVEKVSGRPYADFLQSELLNPLGLTHTRYDSGIGTIPDSAHGYGFDVLSGSHFDAEPLNMTGPFAAGALASTAGDLLRWQIALTGGRAVSPASFEQMITSPVPTGIGEGAYGFGLMVDRLGGQRYIWHNGGINGFNSMLAWFPEMGLRVAVISNSEALSSQAVEEMTVAALTSQTPPAPPRSAAQPGTEAALRKLIAGLAAGTPDYTALTPQMAELSRKQLPVLQPGIQSLGGLRSLEFKGVSLDGVDQYLAQFDDGMLLFLISLDPEGKVGGVQLRPIRPRPH